jgi:hypothetical protein
LSSMLDNDDATTFSHGRGLLGARHWMLRLPSFEVASGIPRDNRERLRIFHKQERGVSSVAMHEVFMRYRLRFGPSK